VILGSLPGGLIFLALRWKQKRVASALSFRICGVQYDVVWDGMGSNHTWATESTASGRWHGILPCVFSFLHAHTLVFLYLVLLVIYLGV